MKAPLCKCLNCNTIMVDKNPIDQPELTCPDNIEDMEFINDTGGGYWACPNCKSDDHLIDLYFYPL